MYMFSQVKDIFQSLIWYLKTKREKLLPTISFRERSQSLWISPRWGMVAIMSEQDHGWAPHCLRFCWARPALSEHDCHLLLDIAAWQPAKSFPGDVSVQHTYASYGGGSVMTRTQTKKRAPKWFLPFERRMIEHISLPLDWRNRLINWHGCGNVQPKTIIRKESVLTTKMAKVNSKTVQCGCKKNVIVSVVYWALCTGYFI